MCIQSVFLQTYQDYEVIIINDGSRNEDIGALEEAKMLTEEFELSVKNVWVLPAQGIVEWLRQKESI